MASLHILSSFTSYKSSTDITLHLILLYTWAIHDVRNYSLIKDLTTILDPKKQLSMYDFQLYYNKKQYVTSTIWCRSYQMRTSALLEIQNGWHPKYLSLLTTFLQITYNHSFFLQVVHQRTQCDTQVFSTMKISEIHFLHIWKSHLVYIIWNNWG